MATHPKAQPQVTDTLLICDLPPTPCINLNEGRSWMKTIAQKGFTLIELAVVIAIIAILAAVAIPRFADTTTSAEESIHRSFKSQLVSAVAMATARTGTPPASLAAIVTNNLPNAMAAGDTLSMSSFVNKATGAPACTDADPVVCTTSRWVGTYTYDQATGIVRAALAPVAPANTRPAIPNF
jgi:type IV pilus assembly protein PilA